MIEKLCCTNTYSWQIIIYCPFIIADKNMQLCVHNNWSKGIRTITEK